MHSLLLVVTFPELFQVAGGHKCDWKYEQRAKDTQDDHNERLLADCLVLVEAGLADADVVRPALVFGPSDNFVLDCVLVTEDLVAVDRLYPLNYTWLLDLGEAVEKCLPLAPFMRAVS